MKKTKKKTQKFRSYRHLFLFKIPSFANPGKFTVIKSWAKVINATRPVTLRLTADDVQQSMRLGGIGNTQTCSMAVCAQRNADAFNHPVEGYIDWQYSRAYVVTKVNREGMPSECVVYNHSDDIAKVNDTKGGQKQLLADLTVNGDREIRLSLPQIRPSQKGETHPWKKEGEIKRGPSKTLHLRGANLRFAVAQLGGVDHK